MHALLVAAVGLTSAQGPAARATLGWINEFVVAEHLCPWAREASSGPGFRLTVVEDLAEFEAQAVRDAGWLNDRDVTPEKSTALIVLSGSAAQPSVAAFGHTCTHVAKHQALDGLDLLGFHPQRIDTGPGCSADPEDAAHFSVRSPLPLIQLLRQDELMRVRRAWKATHRSSLPGALELLHGNKRRLRTIGSASLRARFDSLRSRGARSGDVRMGVVVDGAEDLEAALFTCCLVGAAYFSGYASEGYEPHRL